MNQPQTAYLSICFQNQHKQKFALDSSSSDLAIGRDDTNDIILPNALVSGKHARITFENQKFNIVDLGSKAGTRLNGVPLSPDVPCILKDQDRISIGEFDLEFRDLQSTVFISSGSVDRSTYQLQDDQFPQLRVSTLQWSQDFLLKNRETFIGRSSNCVIRIDSPLVSSRHAKILRTGNVCEIFDLDSTNGLVYDGQRIDRRILKDGDILHIGQLVTLEFHVATPKDIIPFAYNSVLKSLGEGIVILNSDHQIMDINPAAQNFLRTSTRQAIGKTIDWLFTEQPELLSQYLSFSQGQTVSDFPKQQKLPIYNVDSDLGQRFFEMHLSILADDLGRQEGFLLVLHDITKQHETELELRKANEATDTYLQALRKELEIGTQIQKQFLPQEIPQHPYWEFATCFLPAHDVAGDFYDLFPLPGGCIGLVVGDVSDKGVGSALFMALFRSLIRVFAEQSYLLALRSLVAEDNQPQITDFNFEDRLTQLTYTAPLKAVSLANEYIIHNHEKANMFATLFFGVLDPSLGILTYINGGHEAPLILGANRTIKARLTHTGAAVGFLPREKFEVRQIQLDPGDIFLAYTDGVTDARSPDRKFFKENRLLDLVVFPVSTASELLKHIEQAVQNHIDTANQFDDITMLAARWFGTQVDLRDPGS